MSQVSMICASGRLTAFTVALACLAGAASGTAVVVGTTGTDDTVPGDVITAGRIVAPGPGASLTLLQDESLTVVAWPEKLTVTQSAREDDVLRVAGAITDARALSETGSWVRGGAGAQPPSLWYTNVAVGGVQCVPEGAQPRLWRADAAARIELKVEGLDLDETEFVRWPAGEETADWPFGADVSVVGRFLFAAGGTLRATVVLRPVTGETTLDTLVAMADAGCLYQLHLMTQGLPPDFPDG